MTWQKIETAPSDKPVLVFFLEDGKHPGMVTAMHSTAPSLIGWWAWGARQVFPTHWMPLPPAPPEDQP